MVERVDIPVVETGPDAPEQEAEAQPQVVEQPSEEPQERPDWLPEKFKSPEELSKAYGELEAKLSQPSPDRTEPEPIDKPNTESLEQVEEVLESRGLNLEEMSQEYYQDRYLSEERYDQLASAGIPREVVDQFISGQQAVGQQITREAEDIAGGQDNYRDMINWASNSLPSEEIDIYNDAVQSNNRAQILNAVRSLHSRFSQDVGIEPNLSTGSRSLDAGDIYESWSQVTRDMSSIEYKADPAYRAAVEAKLSRSGPLAS
tara:strand:+ start:163 stop:942 length:780 start_codon:yes stop_codon:yes gene_type:complete